MEKFWPAGSEVPIMFVDIEGTEGQDMGSSKNETKVGVDSKFNMEEVELVVRFCDKSIFTQLATYINSCADFDCPISSSARP